MTVALDTPTQVVSNKGPRSLTTVLMTSGFFLYTLLVVAGHLVGFPLGYAYSHNVCADAPLDTHAPGASRCGALTPQNVHALERIGLSIASYANFYMVIQVTYILICVGIAVLIVLKKPGQWVPLGISAYLISLSAYEGTNYPALAATYPILNIPLQFLIVLGMSILGGYAVVTFPNGKFGSRWILGYYLASSFEAVLSVFITNPTFLSFNNVFGLVSFPTVLGISIYRYRRILNAKERIPMKWLILSFSIFIPSIIFGIGILPAITSSDSPTFLVVNMFGFFGCGINITGFLMAVMYANAFDIDVFVRRTLVYGSLTGLLALVYFGLVFALQSFVRVLTGQVSQYPLVIVVSTLTIAVLFQPLRHRIQALIDRRFFRHKYDAERTLAAFTGTLRSEVDLSQMSEDLVAIVQETMQPAHVSLWLRNPAPSHSQNTGMLPQTNEKERH
jgi:hypothetical protein